jgi:hypothetical protein
VAGIFLVLGVFLASAWTSLWLLVLVGWNPLAGPAYTYGGVGVAFTVGAAAVYALFRWARKP